MKKLIFALLLLPVFAFAQSLTIDCSTLKATDPNGNPVTVTCGTTGGSTNSITATFLGADLDKTAGLTVGTDGQNDFHINVQGLPVTPVSTWRIDGNGTGLWVSPSNGTNWIIAVTRNQAVADLWFSQWQLPVPFKLTITFSDGTSSVISGIK